MSAGTQHARSSCRSPRRGALTLVELCVGMVALAGLLAGAVPALRSARSASQLTECQQNLGRIQAASLVYGAEDASGLFIPIAPGDLTNGLHVLSAYGYGGRAGWGKTKPSGIIENSPFSGGSTARMGPADRPLNKMLYKAALPPPPEVSSRSGQVTDYTFDARLPLDTYHCPADTAFAGMHHAAWADSELSSYDFYGTSYGVPTQVAWYAVTLFDAPRNNTVYGRNVETIPAPAQTVAYVENAGLFAYRAANPSIPQCPVEPLLSQVAHGWHGQDFRFNVAFVDGAVRQVEMNGSRCVQPPMCPPPATDCHTMIIRNTGWRFDTVPVRPVLVDKQLDLDGFDAPDWQIVQ